MDDSYICELYTRDRLSLRQIAERVQRDHHWVARRLKRNGIEVSRNNKPSVRLRACEVCGQSFTAAIPTRRFCSHACRGVAIERRMLTLSHMRPSDTRECPTCGESFVCRDTSIQKHCSRRCFDLAHSERMTGSSNPAWVNGESYAKRGQRGPHWEAVRKEIYARDRYTCQDCGTKCIGKRDAKPETTLSIIQCHHIRPYQSPEDNTPENLITLCLGCHLLRHK